MNHLFMRNCSTLFRGGETPLNLLAHVEMALDVLKRGVVGQIVEQLPYFVLGSLHGDLPRITVPDYTRSARPIRRLPSDSVGARPVVPIPPDITVEVSSRGRATRGYSTAMFSRLVGEVTSSVLEGGTNT